MEKNQLLRCKGTIYRVLELEEDCVLLIDCINKTMPKWYDIGWIEEYENCTEEELLETTEMKLPEEQDLGQKARCIIHVERQSLLATNRTLFYPQGAKERQNRISKSRSCRHFMHSFVSRHASA